MKNTVVAIAIRPMRHVQPMWARAICHAQNTTYSVD